LVTGAGALELLRATVHLHDRNPKLVAIAGPVDGSVVRHEVAQAELQTLIMSMFTTWHRKSAEGALPAIGDV
jgi:hypothetical protein